MENRDFDELAGRIEAVARLSLNLVAVLEDKGFMDGAVFAEALRTGIRAPEDSPVLQAAQRTARQLAESIDSSRRFRQSRAGLTDGQRHQS